MGGRWGGVVRLMGSRSGQGSTAMIENESVKATERGSEGCIHEIVVG